MRLAFGNFVIRGDVWVVQRGEGSRLALEARQMTRVVNECLGQKLHRDIAAEFGIRGLIDLPHTARAEMVRDGEVSECGADHCSALLGWRQPRQFLIPVQDHSNLW